jgi:hypothetical protein
MTYKLDIYFKFILIIIQSFLRFGISQFSNAILLD